MIGYRIDSGTIQETNMPGVYATRAEAEAALTDYLQAQKAYHQTEIAKLEQKIADVAAVVEP